MNPYKTERICKTCLKSFYVYTSPSRNGRGIYCSRTCRSNARIGQVGYWLGKERPDMQGKNNSNYGKHPSLYTRKLMSEKAKAYFKKHGSRFAGKPAKHHIGNKYGLGYRHTEEAKKRMSLARLGSKHWNWKGGIRMDSYGYKCILSPNHPFKDHQGYVREHRLVVEKQIGRYLTLKEKVHHIGTKLDNRPNMLMAFKSNGYHLAFERWGTAPTHSIIFDGRLLPLAT